MYKRQLYYYHLGLAQYRLGQFDAAADSMASATQSTLPIVCLLYTSDAADERSSVDLGGRRIIKKKKQEEQLGLSEHMIN